MGTQTDATDAVDLPGYRLHGVLWAGDGRRLYRAEALGDPGRPLLIEAHDSTVDGATLDLVRQRTARIRELGHRGLLPVREIVRIDGAVGVVMPAVGGGCLAELMQGGTHVVLDAATLAAVGDEARAAMDAAHATGVHHGTLAAEQVHFDRGGRPVLIGFGTGALRGADHHCDAPFHKDREDLDQLLEAWRAQALAPDAGSTAVMTDTMIEATGPVPVDRVRPTAALAALLVLAVPVALVTLFLAGS